MSQYDVYPNPSTASADDIPFVVDIQSDLLAGLSTRMTVPLLAAAQTVPYPAALCPAVQVDGRNLVALAHFMAPLPKRLLKRPVGNLAHQSAALVAAVDAVISGF